MAVYSAKTTGSGPFYVDLVVSPQSQDIAGNYTVVAWELWARLASSGWATWSGAAQSWSVSIGGIGGSGSWILDFRPGTARSILIANNASLVIPHNADGTRDLYSSGTLSTNHGSFGSGTAAGTQTLARIPRGPRIYSGGTWRPSVVYVRSGGVWRTATPYVRSGGAWRVSGG